MGRLDIVLYSRKHHLTTIVRSRLLDDRLFSWSARCDLLAFSFRWLVLFNADACLRIQSYELVETDAMYFLHFIQQRKILN